MARQKKQTQANDSEKSSEKSSEKNNSGSKSQLESFLKNNKDSHYNFEKDYDYKISSGSLILDIQTSGGITPGVHRFSGVSEGGKTSCALSYMRNFLKEKGRKGVYIKSEGRLSSDMKIRSGVNFVNFKDWEDQTCFLFESNVFETCLALMKDLIKNNEEDNRYFFILDSMDALVPKGDIDRSFEESDKVAGSALLSSKFLQKMALVLGKRGHIAIMISQVRAAPKINMYEKSDPKPTNASGGNALNHYANWTFEFQQKTKSNLILDKKSNSIVGHFCRLFFRKSTNDKTGLEVKYPIKHGQTGGNSIWLEQELTDSLLAYEQITQRGKWIYISESLLKDLESQGFSVSSQYDGVEKFRNDFFADSRIKDYIYNRFLNLLSEDHSLKEEDLVGEAFDETV